MSTFRNRAASADEVPRQQYTSSALITGANSDRVSKSTTCCSSFGCVKGIRERTHTTTRSYDGSSSNSGSKADPTWPVAPRSRAVLEVSFEIAGAGMDLRLTIDDLKMCK